MTLETTLEHISTLSKTFRSQIRGCSVDEVSALESILGRPVPPVYRDFLLAMGHDAGGITALYAGGFIEPEVDWSYKRVFTMEKKAKERWPERLTMVGRVSSDPYEKVCIDTGPTLSEERIIRHDIGWDRAAIATLLDKRYYYQVALSFREMLFASAFVSFLVPKFAISMSVRKLERDESQLSAALKSMRRLGFEAHPASSGWTRCFTRSDAVAIVYENEVEPLHMHFRTNQRAHAERWGTTLKQELGLGFPQVFDVRDE